MKTMPVWASSMVSNFRRMFKEKYERDTTLSDDQIFTICEEVFDDSDPTNGDKMRVDAMFDMERGRY